MRGFLTRQTPEVTRILLIESGPRELGQRTTERLRAVFPGAQVDVLCCVSSAPEGAEQAWRVQDHVGGRWALLRELRREAHPVAAVLMSGDAIMAPWRWATLATLPAKFLIVNEHVDFFWLDRGHIGPLFQFIQHRSGLGEESIVTTVRRMAGYPFALVYLLAYAAYVHTVRGVRMALGLSRKARA
ncbi:MAG: hypothetical protein H6509_06745 [Bryobacterales bacterium]|nr:hypothetical protein [Bryobacterales bacterium]